MDRSNMNVSEYISTTVLILTVLTYPSLFLTLIFLSIKSPCQCTNSAVHHCEGHSHTAYPKEQSHLRHCLFLRQNKLCISNPFRKILNFTMTQEEAALDFKAHTHTQAHTNSVCQLRDLVRHPSVLKLSQQCPVSGVPSLLQRTAHLTAQKCVYS